MSSEGLGPHSLRGSGSGAGAPLGVVIPTLNEEEALPRLLDDLAELPLPLRIVVVDGGSSDRTREVARSRNALVVEAPRGRDRQLAAGVASLDTPWLLLVHADCRLLPPARKALLDWLREPGPEQAAHFAFRLDARGPWWRAIERGQWVRERLTGLAYGDQGLLISRERLVEVGGIPSLPLMEDAELVRRLRRTGGIHRLPAPMVTSARRYRADGPVIGWLRNASLIALYMMGVPPHRLARWYPSRDGAAGPSGRILVVFAKAPEPGRVKTRLAGEIGAAEAARLYRRLGRLVVDQVRTGPYRTAIWFAPPRAAAEVAAWLGPGPGVELRPQGEGDLGERMARAFDEAFRTAARAVIIGTDAPGVDARLVEEAFEILERSRGPDLVLGPATDGGYYLLGLRRPAPELFRGVPWSTGRVLERTLDRARQSGLSWELLRPLADVDRPEDLPVGLRALSEAG